MRYVRSVIIGMAMLAITISLSSVAFAEIGHGVYKVDKEACAAQIKTLRDSATALHTSNPDLAKGLNDLADKKAAEMPKMQEWKDTHDAKMKLLKDSAAALKTSNPALAQELQKMSEKKHMEEKEEIKK